MDQVLVDPDTEENSPHHHEVPLFRHRVKDEWGLAVLMWEREAKRGYRFEDGELRIFKEAYYELLEEADATVDRRERLLTAAQVADAAQAPRTPSKKTRAQKRAISNAIPITDQIAYFRNLHPNGFAGDVWQHEHRKQPEKSNLKRHRDPVIAHAQEALSPAAIEAAIDAQEYATIIQHLVEVLSQSDLVSAAQVSNVEAISGHHVERVARALRGVLYGEGPMAVRFDAWVGSISAALDRKPGWQLITVPLALIHPEQHICVRPSSFRTQATWMAPTLKLGTMPASAIYERALDMATRVRAELLQAELEPADLMDVHDFMWVTLKPKARDAIVAMKSGAAAS